MIKNRIIYDVNTGVVLDIIVPQILIVGQDEFVEFSLEFMDGLNKVTNINWQVVTIFERPDGEKSNKLLATLTGDAYIKKIPSWATDIEGILKITTQIIVGGTTQPLGIALIPVEEGLEPANDTITEAQYQLLTSELNGLNNKIEAHQNRVDNPHQVTKAQVGLENVDPTSDIDKPVSTAQKTYIDSQDNALGVRIDNVETNIDEEKIDKDFTAYTELTTDLSDDDYIVVRDISNNQTKKTKVSALRQFETNTYEYGVRWVEGQSSSTLERVKIVNGEMTVGSATGLVANVGIDDQVVENSFDNINIFIRNRVVIDGNTMVRVNKYYIREYSVNDGGTIRNYILMCEKKLTGYRLPIRFDNGDGTEKDYAYLPAYEGYVDGSGIGRSISGVLPTTSITRNNSRIACRKNDGDGTNTDSLWGQVDFAEYYDLVQVPIWIEFANFYTQAGIGRGVVDLTFAEDTVADSTVNNTAIIANNANFDVDMTIYLSTGTYHQITQIDVDTPIAGQTTLTFNGDTVLPLTGVNIDPRQYFTGMTDSVVASTGFYKANDGKHPFKWRGMENVWGNIWKFVDGVKISNWYAWVSTNPAHYDDLASDVNGDYGSNWTKLSYQNALSNGYISKLGYDDRFPFARLPIEVGAGSTTYYADYYYQNSGDRTLLVGGGWYHGSAAGLTYWIADSTLSHTNYGIGFRLSYRP